jgi:hypothetical protein
MDNGMRKLTVEQVLEVRIRYARGERVWSLLAREFGVSREAVKAAALGFTFKGLPMPPQRRLDQPPFRNG